MVESQSRLLLPLYGQLEVVASSHDNILRVLVPQIVHLRVIDPDNCIAGLQTSRFRRRSGINLQCTMFTQQTNIVFFSKNDNPDESVVDTWPIFQGYADSVLSVEETFGRLEPLYLSACVTPRMSDTVHPFTRGRSKKEGFAENTSRNVEDKPGGALLKSKNTFFARSKTLLLFISCCSLIVHEA